MQHVVQHAMFGQHVLLDGMMGSIFCWVACLGGCLAAVDNMLCWAAYWAEYCVDRQVGQ